MMGLAIGSLSGTRIPEKKAGGMAARRASPDGANGAS
jgi:hypothetical protein